MHCELNFELLPDRRSQLHCKEGVAPAFEEVIFIPNLLHAEQITPHICKNTQCVIAVLSVRAPVAVTGHSKCVPDGPETGWTERVSLPLERVCRQWHTPAQFVTPEVGPIHTYALTPETSHGGQ